MTSNSASAMQRMTEKANASLSADLLYSAAKLAVVTISVVISPCCMISVSRPYFRAELLVLATIYSIFVAASSKNGAGKQHQVCLAHLIRDVQYAIDCGDEVFAPPLRHLLGRACRLGRRRERLSDATLKSYERRLDARLDQLMALEPSHQAGVKLKSMIRRTRASLFVFMTRRELPPTNNGSERALRPCAVFRKITNGFRTEWGAKLYADIRSTIETGRRRAIGALEAIRLTLAGKPLLLAGLFGSLKATEFGEVQAGHRIRLAAARFACSMYSAKPRQHERIQCVCISC